MSMTRTKGAAIWRLAQRRRSSSSRCFFLRVIIIHPRRAHINLASLVAREEWHVTRPFDPVSPKENWSRQTAALYMRIGRSPAAR